MAYPQWTTSANLGIYSETYSFNVNPLIIGYGADQPAVITLTNGALPLGLSWTAGVGNVTITGESLGIAADTLGQFTLRITDRNGIVDDRTFSILLTAIQLPPDWTGQPQFIGYIASAGTAAWTVQATSPQGQAVTYSIAMFSPPAGLAISSTTGVLTYTAPSVISDTNIPFVLRATTGAVYSDLNCTISVLTVPHVPAWETNQGLVAEVSEGDYVDLAVMAFDSSGGSITYALVSASPSFPFTLTSSGLIYGQVPTLYTETTYQFVISATNATGSANRTFYILASPVTASTALYWSSATGDLGLVQDGQYTTLDVSAVSSRGVVTHSITGGQLPLTMILVRQAGQIVGFLEYQLRDRSYVFDVTATDGVETISRSFHVSVYKGTNGQFMGLSIPLEGSLKDLYYDFIGTAIQPQWYALPSTTPQSVLTSPFISWIQGLNYSSDDPASALNAANLHLNTTEIMVGAVTNVNVGASSTLFYAPILDQDAGADYEIAQVHGEVAYTNNATVTIQTGTVTFGFVRTPENLVATPLTTSIVPGTVLRVVMPYATYNWMQGQVISLSAYGSLSLAVSMTNGSGVSSAWTFYPAPVYPPSLENVRTDLVSALGWTNDGDGSGAQLLPIVDPASTGISAVQVIAPGSGFLYPPDMVVTGSSNSATLSSTLTVVGVSILNVGTGWTVGDIITFDPPAEDPASLQVTAVDSQGGIVGLSLVNGGVYSRWPDTPQLIIHDSGLPARLLVQLGIGSVSIVHPGNGYVQGSTAVSTAGSEPLPPWQPSWFPYLSIGTVQNQYAARTYGSYSPAGNVVPTFGNLTTTQSLLYYQRWPLQHVILELQGLNWTGDTTLDATQTQFDGGYTAFAEWTEPRDTLFDGDLEIFDGGNTRFDDDYAAWQALAQRTWGVTEFDQYFTIFDLYTTLFDDANISTQSITLLRRLLRVITQQISGHDVVV